MKKIIASLLIVACASPLTTQAEQAKKPDAWYPRTESVGPDEMFVVALGTGMPTPITRAQKSSAWYVELGNGDIFLFDVGSGSAENLFALRPDFARVNKAFASHLHTDHVGDVPALWIGGWLSGRYEPLHIYGPSGAEPELGTAAFVEGLKRLSPGMCAVVPARCPTPADNSSSTSSTTSRWG